MTDLELTKLCAEAVGITGHPVIESCEMWTPEGWEKNKDGLVTHNGPNQIYNPLHDDAQAMALVKKFQLDIEAPFEGQPHWVVVHEDGGGGNPDLSRAIVECVAQIQSKIRAAK